MSDFVEVQRWLMETKLLHFSMLRWYNTVGYARHAGVSVDMVDPLRLDWAREIKDLEYIPGIVCTADGIPMTDDQQSSIKKLLIQMSEDARAALNGDSTLAIIF